MPALRHLPEGRHQAAQSIRVANDPDRAHRHEARWCGLSYRISLGRAARSAEAQIRADSWMVETVLERVGNLSGIRASAPARRRRRVRVQIRPVTRADQIGSLGEVEPTRAWLRAGEIDEWALEISEGQRIQIRIEDTSRRCGQRPQRAAMLIESSVMQLNRVYREELAFSRGRASPNVSGCQNHTDGNATRCDRSEIRRHGVTLS